MQAIAVKKIFFTWCILMASVCSYSQTFTGSSGTIPDNGPVTSFPCLVNGLSPSAIDTSFGVESVCININHNETGDLTIQLQAPDGTIIDLSVENGGNGNNYTGTCFTATATNPITGGNAPFNGDFISQGNLGNVNNGQNGNGTWNLLVQDNYWTHSGSVVSWNITFGTSPAQPFLFLSSNLPIVVINTSGQLIPDDPKINAQMGIINNGPGIRNYMTDPFNDYNNNIGIEVRGSSSQMFPQKQYSIETRDTGNIEHDTLVLGMPSENAWILYAPYDDKTCLRNYLSYDIANKTGHYASRTVFCELVLNGEYKGIYVMMEKIKHDNNRVDIAKLLPADTTGDQLTGGYIIKIDKFTGSGGGGWNSNYQTSAGKNVYFQYEYPSDVDIMTQQSDYIQAYVDSFEYALNSPYFQTDSGYQKYIDVNSFIDYFILNEASRNVDGYRLSTYLYKKKDSDGGKLFAGPAWDYNLGWWNADYCDGDLTTGWAYNFNNVCGGDANTVPFWWTRLLQDTSFTSALKCRWISLRQTILNTDTINNFVDSAALYLDEAKDRHFTVWPILGVYTWPNPSPIPTDYPGEIAALKGWIQQRLAWIDTHLPGNCITTGLAATDKFNFDFNIFPNPFSNHITIHSEKLFEKNKPLVVKVLDMYGRTISSQLLLSPTHQLQTANWQQGVYFLKITSANVEWNFKLVKN